MISMGRMGIISSLGHGGMRDPSGINDGPSDGNGVL